jgi:hypothetical protein
MNGLKYLIAKWRAPFPFHIFLLLYKLYQLFGINFSIFYPKIAIRLIYQSFLILSLIYKQKRGKMVSITDVKEREGKYAFLVSANHADWKALKGSIHNLHFISEEHATVKATLLERGRKGSSKYWLIPKCLREGVMIPKETPCLKTESSDKIIYAFIVDKPIKSSKS